MTAPIPQQEQAIRPAIFDGISIKDFDKSNRFAQVFVSAKSSQDGVIIGFQDNWCDPDGAPQKTRHIAIQKDDAHAIMQRVNIVAGIQSKKQDTGFYIKVAFPTAMGRGTAGQTIVIPAPKMNGFISVIKDAITPKEPAERAGVVQQKAHTPT